MNICDDMIDLIGKTPIVRLSKITSLCYASIYGKLESFNPGGSVKDRLAFAMIRDAEKKGLVDSDTQIIEPSSGNTGIALAMICAVKGYRLMITMPESMSKERISLMRMYGAEVILTPAELGMRGAIDKAESLAAYYPKSHMPYQFQNEANVKMHYKTTGPEIWNAFDGNIQIFVAGVGTGGTVSGVGMYLKEQNPNIKIVAVEPFESPVLSGGQAAPHRIQGIGAGFVPPIFKRELVDEIITVKYLDAFETSQKLAEKEGILCGISSGANVFASMEIAKKFDYVGQNIATIICDTGERYLSNMQQL